MRLGVVVGVQGVVGVQVVQGVRGVVVVGVVVGSVLSLSKYAGE